MCRAGVCVIASSHDLNHTLHHVDQVWLMAQSKVIAQGTASANSMGCRFACGSWTIVRC
ncbi:hypothetical protein [Candidatus Pantoea persica]|uniref:hypothetical protein n=1 Tax=Candidatus Pantoea persica TaxID=2518128 RepID=UPI00215DA053|nr:hypothetical protein [Candidatus Pantoea persica]